VLNAIASNPVIQAKGCVSSQREGKESKMNTAAPRKYEPICFAQPEAQT
jgi:hypothetical protein